MCDDYDIQGCLAPLPSSVQVFSRPHAIPLSKRLCPFIRFAVQLNHGRYQCIQCSQQFQLLESLKVHQHFIVEHGEWYFSTLLQNPKFYCIDKKLKWSRRNEYFRSLKIHIPFEPRPSEPNVSNEVETPKHSQSTFKSLTKTLEKEWSQKLHCDFTSKMQYPDELPSYRKTPLTSEEKAQLMRDGFLYLSNISPYLPTHEIILCLAREVASRVSLLNSDGSGRTTNRKYTGSTYITNRDCRKYLQAIQDNVNVILERYFPCDSQMNLIGTLAPEPKQVPHFDQVFCCTKIDFIEEYDYVPLTVIYFH
jgi:hypothetical protein